MRIIWFFTLNIRFETDYKIAAKISDEFVLKMFECVGVIGGTQEHISHNKILRET